MEAGFISLLAFYGLALNLGAAIMFAMPIILHPKISLDDRRVARHVGMPSIASLAESETERAIIDYNKKIWEAVVEQRKYTLIGLVMLSIGIAMQVLG